MVKIIDKRNKAMGGSSKRSTSQIKNIAIHYSASTSGNTALFENFWKGTHGWNTGGYHEVVLLDGRVELNYDPNVISNGVGGQNTRMYNICYVGLGKPNSKQLKTLRERVNYNRKRFGISVGNVKGHREYQGQSTSCPALDMNAFRKSLSNTSTKTKKPTTRSNKTTSKSKKSVKPDYNTTSVVEFLQSIGQPFSFNSRKKLANVYGVGGGNYKGTIAQNVELLNRIKKDYKATGKVRTTKSKQATSKPKTSIIKYPLPTSTLRRGSNGNAVRQLQRALNKANFNVGKVDAYFGKKTEDAVRRFQMVYDPKVVDGVYGKRTRTRLNKIVNK